MPTHYASKTELYSPGSFIRREERLFREPRLKFELRFRNSEIGQLHAANSAEMLQRVTGNQVLISVSNSDERYLVLKRWTGTKWVLG